MSNHNEDPANLPGDHDDPKAGSSLYWMAVMFVAVLVAAWALQGLATYAEVQWERSQVKAFGAEGGGELGRLNAEHAADLEKSISGDVLTLKNGTVINAGLVYELEDPADKTTKVFVKALPFLKVFETKKKADFGKWTVVQGGKELKFSPDQVGQIEKGRGKKLAIPFAQAKRAYLAQHQRG